MKQTIVIGAGITGLTTALYLRRAGIPVLVLEEAERAGGQIRTLQEEGYTFETGPNTGSISFPEVAELFALLPPQRASADTFIRKDDCINFPQVLGAGSRHRSSR